MRDRIVGRGTETEDIINERMTVAKEEIDLMTMYDYVVENDKVEWAVERIKAIVTAEHCKRERLIKNTKNLWRSKNNAVPFN